MIKKVLEAVKGFFGKLGSFFKELITEIKKAIDNESNTPKGA
jgi:hypothetical protein